jgi:putative phosphoribosyl transferase
MIYRDRHDAGRKLAKELIKYKDENPIIIALPRGGVVVGNEVAKMLDAPMDVIVVRKIGAPSQPEFGIGAIAPNGIQVLDTESIRLLGIPEDELEEIIEQETTEINRRIRLYREGLPKLDLSEKTVIIVDDGLATGVTARAAVLAVKQMNPKKIIFAVPVSSPVTAEKFRREVDEFVCLSEPPDFYGVGAYYENFKQVTDEEVIKLLQAARKN